MVVLRYKINFSKERHQPYEDGFYNRDTITNYYLELNKFLLDKNLSSSDGDDVELFKDLLFESKFSKVHLTYANWLIGLDTYHSKADIIDSYIRYITQISILHARDFWLLLFNEKNNSLIERLIKLGTVETKLALVRAAVEYKPELMKSIPKLKTYLIFS